MIIGLTGGIASGKSTAARYLGELGAHVIDADLLGHRAYEPGSPGFRQVVEAFGSEIVAVDGSIDRRALGARVFGQPDALRQLTDIVWPEILRLAHQEIEQVRDTDSGRIIVLEAAVLLEAGWDAFVDEVWVVVVDRDTAVARASARDGGDAAAVQQRIDAQLSNAQRQERAQVVIDNSADEAALREQLQREWQRITGPAA